MDLIHYVVKDGVLDSAAQLGDTISPMDQHGASEVDLPLVFLFPLIGTPFTKQD